MAQRPILCPRCRTLIGSEETACSRCGVSRNASWWKFVNLTRAGVSENRLVKALITVNIAFFALSLLLSMAMGESGFFSPGTASLSILGATGVDPLSRNGYDWTLISANYLHGGILHLLFNMMALRQIGPWVIKEYGASRMFVIYTLGGVFGFWVSCLAGVTFTIGASASICALIGALLFFGRDSGGAYGQSVYREVSGWVVSLVVFGLIIPGINNWSHGGGIVGGMLLGKLLGYRGRNRETSLHTVLALVCVVLTVAALGWGVAHALKI